MIKWGERIKNNNIIIFFEIVIFFSEIQFKKIILNDLGRGGDGGYVEIFKIVLFKLIKDKGFMITDKSCEEKR